MRYFHLLKLAHRLLLLPQHPSFNQSENAQTMLISEESLLPDTADVHLSPPGQHLTSLKGKNVETVDQEIWEEKEKPFFDSQQKAYANLVLCT